jgi:aerobic C4-dicarboxylate transport protein
MSEARALTNFAGNAVATLLIGTWTGEVDKERVRRVLAGELPFDERTLLDDASGDGAPKHLPERREGGEKELATA